MNKEQLTNVICEHIEAQFRSDKIDSYNGAKNFRNVVELFGGKFVVDND